jgi:hypothetical protein
MLQLPFLDRVKYIVERQFVKGALFQLLVVGVFIGLISIIGGLLVWPTGDPFTDPWDAIWWAFLRLTDPGYLGDDEGNWRRLVSTTLTILGYVVFMGTLVAILTRSLIARMNDLERGLTPVTLRHHVVVLGWTSRTVPLVQELLASSSRVRRFLQLRATRRLRLVVLSEQVSAAQLLHLRKEQGIGSQARHIVLRSGTPLQPDALHRVACLNAAAVIVPSGSHGPESLVTSDVETVKALLSMSSQGQYLGQELPYVVAEIEDARKQSLAERAYPGPLEVIAGDATISRLLVQTLLHPGFSEVINELLRSGSGNEIYIRTGSLADGRTLEEFARRCPRAVILGLLQWNAGAFQPALNLSSKTPIGAKDLIICMAEDYEATEPDEKSERLPLEPVSRIGEPTLPACYARRAHRVLILGWNRRVPALLAEMNAYVEHDFEVTIASLVPVDERESAVSDYLAEDSRIKCSQRIADFTVEAELRRQHPETYSSIFLLSSDRLSSGEEADARTMMGYLQLEAILETAGNRPQVLLDLSDPDNETLLVTNRSETLVSPLILSHIMAQVALRRELRLVLDDLLTPGGGEIMFRDPGEYGIGSRQDFGRIEQVVAEHGETALGLYTAQPDQRGSRLRLNPDREHTIAFREGDQLVVLGRVDEVIGQADGVAPGAS